MFQFLTFQHNSFIYLNFQPLPWTAFDDDSVHFWLHYGFVILAFVLSVITFVVQMSKPAPYGKHASQVGIIIYTCDIQCNGEWCMQIISLLQACEAHY